MAIHFDFCDCEVKLPDSTLLKNWIRTVIVNHGRSIGRINYLFCNDEYIYDVNVRFLNHDTYTDIITFDYVEGNVISGDILISVDRVGENALNIGVPFEQELCRVIIHGVLHLLGFKDKTDKDASQMRNKEDESLALLSL